MEAPLPTLGELLQQNSRAETAKYGRMRSLLYLPFLALALTCNCAPICTRWYRPKRVHTPPVNKNFLLRVVKEADNHNERLLYDEHFRSQARLNAVEDRLRSATQHPSLSPTRQRP